MLTRRVPTSSMTPWYLQVASTCARGTFARMLLWLVSVFFFMFFDIFQVAKEHSPSYELALIHIGTLRRDSLVVVYSYLYLPMHFASLIQRIWYKLIRPHLIAKENTRVGLLDSRRLWSAQPAPGAHMDLPLSWRESCKSPWTSQVHRGAWSAGRQLWNLWIVAQSWRLLLLQQVVAKHLGNGRKRHVGMSQNTTKKI